MAETERVSDLEIREDPELEARGWKVQRIAWLVMVLILLAALLGVFGSGPLSKAKRGDKNGSLSLEYPRFGRFQTSMTLHAQLRPSSPGEDRARLWINRKYLRDMQVEDLTPEPSDVEISGDGAAYVYDLHGAAEPVQVVLHVTPQRMGTVSGRMGSSPDRAFALKHFIYP